MYRPRAAVGAFPPGSWLSIILCISVFDLLAAYTAHTRELFHRKPTFNFKNCLNFLDNFEDEINKQHNKIQKQLNCTEPYIKIANPLWCEEKIRNACMAGSALQQGGCPSAESDAIQKLPKCTETLYAILHSIVINISTSDMPPVLDAANNLTQALNDSHIFTNQATQLNKGNKSEREMEQCELILSLQKVVEVLKRNLKYLKQEANLERSSSGITHL